MKTSHIKSDIKEIANNLGNEVIGLSGKTVMITGGQGFLGRYFTEVFDYLNKNLLDKSCNLIVLDNLITSGKLGAKFRDRSNIQFVKHDIIKPLEWDTKLDFVVHAAGIASPYYYRAHPLKTLEVATIGTKNMLNLANKYGARFTFFSSSEIYGDPDPKHIPIQESYRGNVSVAGPRACYDESKRLGETLCYVYHNMYGTSTNTIRPFNVFGPGMQESDYRALPNFASKIKAGKPLSIYSSGNQTRTFCYITDAITGFILVMLKGVPGEAYNIGIPDPEISMLDLVKRMEKVISHRIDYKTIEYPDSYPADEPLRRCPDIRKASLQLNYKPKVNLDEGLRRFLNWTDQEYSG